MCACVWFVPFKCFWFNINIKDDVVKFKDAIKCVVLFSHPKQKNTFTVETQTSDSNRDIEGSTRATDLTVKRKKQTSTVRNLNVLIYLINLSLCLTED